MAFIQFLSPLGVTYRGVLLSAKIQTFTNMLIMHPRAARVIMFYVVLQHECRIIANRNVYMAKNNVEKHKYKTHFVTANVHW